VRGKAIRVRGGDVQVVLGEGRRAADSMHEPPAWPVTAALGGSCFRRAPPHPPCITTSVISTDTFLLDDTVLIEVGV
jgi:hypothetical protein